MLPIPITNTMSLLSALQLAKGYVELGRRSYTDLSEAFYKSTADNSPLPSGLTTRAIVAAMVLSFAIEIYLKALAFQRLGTFTRGHVLEELIDHLPSDVQAAVRQNYEDQVSNKLNFLHLRFELSTSHTKSPTENSASPGLVIDHGDEWPGRTFDEAIRLASPLFVKLRYFHEDARNGFVSEIDFRWLFYLLDAVRTEIHADAIQRRKSKLQFSFTQSQT